MALVQSHLGTGSYAQNRNRTPLTIPLSFQASRGRPVAPAASVRIITAVPPPPRDVITAANDVTRRHGHEVAGPAEQLRLGRREDGLRLPAQDHRRAAAA